MNGKVYIGTSGWSYRHWIGRFYPVEIKTKEWLNHYSRFFNTVEINSSFYHLISEKTYAKWYDTVPEKFQFAVKMSRFVTHVKRLGDVSEPLDNFLKGVLRLKEKLGIILVQLPPSMKFDVKRIENFIQILYDKKVLPTIRVSFEVRNQTFLCDRFYDILRKNKIALCFSDWPGVEVDNPVIADYIYIRRHGPKSLYASNYTDDDLKKDLEMMRDVLNKGMDSYIYFNNDAYAFAVDCCFRIKEMLK
ncbi:MAG: DUF72 domain-containing protein [Candidatus Marinimicrobia bacterium]|nr:DUF72 domain-containing protein [Candidatus Neomarinimicrobiota bacterium]